MMDDGRSYVMRGGLPFTVEKLAESKNSVSIAFIGGSVTAGAGASDTERTSYRALLYDYFRRRFPGVPFRFIHAAIGGTDSTYGAFRMQDHLLSQGNVDLLFVEFAVNDGGNRTSSVRAMEGIVRQAKASNPRLEIVFLYTASRKGSEQFARTGEPQANIANHEEVAAYYGLPSVHMAGAVYRMLLEEGVRWEELSGDDVHPNDYGYSLYADCIKVFLKQALHTGAPAPADPPLPVPLDPLCYEFAAMLPPSVVTDLAGGRTIAGWSTEKTCNWTPPADILLLDGAGAGFQVRFSGTAVGIALLAGMETGDIEVSIDGRPFVPITLFDPYCLMFYRPKAVLLADDLTPGTHIAEIRLSESRPEEKAGHSLHMLNVLVNGRREWDTLQC